MGKGAMDNQRTQAHSELLLPTFSCFSPWPSSLKPVKSFPIHSYLTCFATFPCISPVLYVSTPNFSLSLTCSLLHASFFIASPCLSVAMPDKCSSYMYPHHGSLPFSLKGHNSALRSPWCGELISRAFISCLTVKQRGRSIYAPVHTPR